MFRMMW